MNKEDVFSSVSWVVSWAGASLESSIEDRTFLDKNKAIRFRDSKSYRPSMRVEEVLSIIKVKKLSEKELILTEN